MSIKLTFKYFLLVQTLLVPIFGLERYDQPPILSVGIEESLKSVYVSAQHGFRVFNFYPQKTLLFTRWNSKALKFEITSRGFGFLRKSDIRVVEIEPFKKGLVYVNGRAYRGKLKLFEDRFGKITVVNLVDLESYL